MRRRGGLEDVGSGGARLTQEGRLGTMRPQSKDIQLARYQLC